MLHTCATCGRPYQRRPQVQRDYWCLACTPHGRATRSPSTQAQDAEYRRNRRVVLAGDPACHWCGVRLATLPARQRTADHLTPVAKGGTHALENLVPACRTCNTSRQADPTWRPTNATRGTGSGGAAPVPPAPAARRTTRTTRLA